MLKKRVIANLVIKNRIVVQSRNFNSYLPVGRPEISVEYLNRWGIDEIILSDITASVNKTEPDYILVKKASSKCNVPLTVGGGINTIDQIHKLVSCGADKISLNQSAIHKPGLISEAARVFGSQCVVVSINSSYNNGSYSVYDYITKKVIDISPADLAKRSQELGAGEIIINSVERDGSYIGYDLELVEAISNCVTIPVIAIGGARNANDMTNLLLNTNVSAAAASNFYHFAEHSVIISKSIINRRMELRLDTQANYLNSKFDYDCRLIKKSDRELEDMLFIKIEKEVI